VSYLIWETCRGWALALHGVGPEGQLVGVYIARADAVRARREARAWSRMQREDARIEQDATRLAEAAGARAIDRAFARGVGQELDRRLAAAAAARA